MRIAVASSGLGHVQRGIEAWARMLAENLHREREQVVLFHGGGRYDCDNVRLHYVKRGDMTARLIEKTAPPFLWRLGWTSSYALEQKSFAAALIRALRRERFDVVHTQDVTVARLLELARQRGKINVPVLLAHGTDEDLESLRPVRYVQHLSPDHQARARHFMGEQVAHFCIPNFVDTEIFCPAPSEPGSTSGTEDKGAFVIGCAAALKRGHKRIDALIRNVARLASSPGALPGGRERVCLFLAGASTGETRDLELLARRELGRHCLILKDLQFEQMPDFYRSLDLYVHAAAEEFFGICFLEAMACGVPVLAHDSPTLRWIVGADQAPDRDRTGAGGWCLDVTKEGFLVEAWPRILSEYEERRASARVHVEETFSWEAVYPRFMDMYEHVAEAEAREERTAYA